jgi:hypothetical protein
LPTPADLLLELAELRIFAVSHRITGIEVA